MANRRPQPGNRRMDFGRNDRNKNFRSGVSPWQGGGPGNDLPNLLPLAGGSTEATLALASNIINLLQPRQNPVPSLLDMPMRRDFGPNMGRYDRGYPPNRMGNQGNFRRTGNYNRAGERINTNRKPFRPNDGPRQPNKNAQRKEADPKPKVKASDEKETEGEASKEQKEAPKTRYDDINPQLLRCHICNKSMWDGRSFENHLSGRAHAIMMQKTAESYALTADTMRQEFKIREIKRTRKTGQHPPRDFYCAMCDMYAADGAIHRTTVGHRKLKKYLHPTCAGCHKEMPTRIELDEHRLTVEHLREMQNKQEVVTKPKPEVMVISTLNMEQMYLREDPPQRRRFNKDDNDDSNKEGDEIKKEADDGEAEDKPQEEDTTTKKPPMDTEDTVLDYNDGDDLSHLTPEMVPAYSTERGVGASFLQEFRCYQCKLCRKLLDSEETAEVHLRTWRHHRLFVRLLAEKSGKETPGESNKRPHNSDDTGNWKRRKTDDDNGGQDKDNADNGQGDDNGGNDNGDNDVQVKSETKNDEEELLANGEQETANEDDLEDWENTVDEILQNEDNEEPAEEPAEEQTQVEEEPEPAPEPEPEPAPEPEPDTKPESPAKVARTPRGRGRGRRRY